ncbi:MAG TPA: DUF5996 family protein, partial [Puia sp.]|nr:DUF5996 family protein [Puia sp.]
MAEYPQLRWPELIYTDYKDTVATVHLWSQIIGKIRLKKTPWLNHSWHVTLYISARGLTTGSIPYGKGVFQIDMDFVSHEVIISCGDGGRQAIKLHSRSVADFYRELFARLHEMDIGVAIYPIPNEIDPAIPFEQDTTQRAYDPVQMHLLWQALALMEPVFV